MKKEKYTEAEPQSELDKLTISKSYPFLSLTKTSSLTLQELKILDCFLAKINPTDPKSTSVRFSRGELEMLCGGKRIRKEDLVQRLRHLCTNVTLYDPKDPDKFKVISLFEEAVASLDQQSGTWVVDLQCTEKAKKYIFNLPQYLRYQLQRVMNLRSRYAYALFLYIRRNSFRKKWREPLVSLRKELSCDDPTYEEFRYLNYKILRPAQKELKEKADCLFTYTPCTAGGKRVVEVEFEILVSETDKAEAKIFQSRQTQGVCEPIFDESDLAGFPGASEAIPADYELLEEETESHELWETGGDLLQFMHDIAPAFSYEELRALEGLVIHVPDELKPVRKYIDNPYMSPSVLTNQAYFSDKVNLLAQYEKKSLTQGTPIRNRFLYLKKMIEQDMYEKE